jgi:hypothetical protein
MWVDAVSEYRWNDLSKKEQGIIHGEGRFLSGMIYLVFVLLYLFKKLTFVCTTLEQI